MNKVKRIKCPDCQNYMTVNINENGDAKGHCNKCNSVIITRSPSAKETVIKILKV